MVSAEMMSPNFPAEFYRWLLRKECEQQAKWCIIAVELSTQEATEFCNQINLIHDDGQKCWMTFGKREIEFLSSDETCLGLMNIESEHHHPVSRQVLLKLAEHGNAIITDQEALKITDGLANILHLKKDSHRITLEGLPEAAEIRSAELMASLAAQFIETLALPPLNRNNQPIIN